MLSPSAHPSEVQGLDSLLQGLLPAQQLADTIGQRDVFTIHVAAPAPVLRGHLQLHAPLAIPDAVDDPRPLDTRPKNHLAADYRDEGGEVRQVHSHILLHVFLGAQEIYQLSQDFQKSLETCCWILLGPFEAMWQVQQLVGLLLDPISQEVLLESLPVPGVEALPRLENLLKIH